MKIFYVFASIFFVGAWLTLDFSSKLRMDGRLASPYLVRALLQSDDADNVYPEYPTPI